MTSQYQNNIILYFLAFPPLKKICEKFGQLPGKHHMFHALPRGLNLFLWWHSLWRHTHQTQTHRMFMQFPKYKLQRKPLLKTLNRTQPRFKSIYMRGQAETMSNHYCPMDQILLKFTWKTKNCLNKDSGFVKSAVQPEYFLHYKHVYVINMCMLISCLF